MILGVWAEFEAEIGPPTLHTDVRCRMVRIMIVKKGGKLATTSMEQSPLTWQEMSRILLNPVMIMCSK
jgi:hypothetical protein